ncbi:prostatic acid phosphatase-like [Paramacrobiotus metropolitanus]|uniref:prostatic acid phosphatase-like n=1 Tax=Paramacrobiotus metropolitanus TaxID=2943436 RepID=UPI002445F168|nr:prostatic acid phosphatase-like [Paramacrobiotus metropolitanus]
MRFRIWTTLCILFSLILTVISVDVVDDLRLVHIVFRHGDRAPLNVYKSDPYGVKIWKGGLGKLTNKGTKQLYEMGKFFKPRYSRFLDAENARSQIYIRSSDADRTLHSAGAFAAGMFPPTADEKWDNQLGQIWRPVSIHTVPEKEENLLSQKTDCPAYKRFKKEQMSHPETKRLYDHYRPLFDWITQNSGEASNIKTMADAYDIMNRVRDVTFCQVSNGYAMPAWMNDTMLRQMTRIHELDFHVKAGANADYPRARLAGGRMLQVILEHLAITMDNVTEPEDDIKLYIYSAHDNAVAALLSTLGVYDYNVTEGDFVGLGQPKYGAAVIVELFNNHTVRVSYKNDPDNIPTAEPTVLINPHCPAYCPLDKFKILAKPYLVDDWDQECEIIVETSWRR